MSVVALEEAFSLFVWQRKARQNFGMAVTYEDKRLMGS